MKMRLIQEYYKHKDLIRKAVEDAKEDYLHATAAINILGQYFFKDGTDSLWAQIVEEIGGSPELKELMDEYFIVFFVGMKTNNNYEEIHKKLEEWRDMNVKPQDLIN